MGLGCGFLVVLDEVHRTSALAHSAMKVVEAVLVMAGGAGCWGLLLPGI